MKKLLFPYLLLLLVSFAPQAQADTALQLGVLAFRPKAQAIAQWQPLATYLQKSIGKPVKLSIYNLAEMEAALSRGNLDIVITNPGHYIQLKQRHALSLPLVTQIGKDGRNYLSVFGGVIFVRADSTLTKLSELRDQRFAFVDPEGLGGYQMQAFELLQAGVDLPQGELGMITGLPQDKVVEAVMNRRAEVGFVRSGVLESMVKEGKLDLSSIRVINKQFVPGFPYALSTRVYPEWPVVVSSSMDEDVAKNLAIALLALPAGGEVAKSAGIHGFTLPSSYREIENLLRSLHVPPFDKMPELTLAELWQKYAVGIASALVFAVMGIALLLQVKRVRQGQQSFTETILSAAGALIVVMDADGKVVRFNKAAEELSGYRLHEIQGHPLWDFMIPRECIPVLQDMMENNRRNPMRRNYEAEWQVRGGERRLISWSTAPIIGAYGQLQFLVEVGIDVTGRNLEGRDRGAPESE